MMSAALIVARCRCRRVLANRSGLLEAEVSAVASSFQFLCASGMFPARLVNPSDQVLLQWRTPETTVSPFAGGGRKWMTI